MAELAKAPTHQKSTVGRRLRDAILTLPVGYYHIVLLGMSMRPQDVFTALKQALQVLKFASVGIGVALTGYGVLFVLTDVVGMPGQLAYLFEAALSVELNFLGSRYITWRGRRHKAGFWKTWLRFHVGRGITFAINQAVFDAQIWIYRTWPGFFGFTLHHWHPGFYYGYYVANTVCIIVSLRFNYVVNDDVVFAEERQTESVQIDEQATPRICIVVPCRNNDLSRLMRHVLALDYVRRHHDKVRLVLVGNVREESWRTIEVAEDWQHELLRLIEVRVQFTPGRDANAKRLRGIRYVQSTLDPDELVVVLDSDGAPEPDYLDLVIHRVYEQDYPVVAGPVPSIPERQNRFWETFIDKAGGKVPTVTSAYELTFGTVGLKKMPVTANLAMRMSVINAVGGPAEDFTNSFEDYEWLLRILAAGFTILCDPALAVPREHRVGFRPLRREYTRSGRGSADFMVRHFHNLFTTWQLLRLNGLLVGLLVAANAAVWAPALALVFGCALVLSSELGVLVKTRKLVALAFPFLAFFYSLCAVWGNASRFYRMGRKRQRPPYVEQRFEVLTLDKAMSRIHQYEGGLGTRKIPHRRAVSAVPFDWARLFAPAMTALLVIAGLLRLVGLAHHPAADYDEWNYLEVGRNVAEHHGIMAKTPVGQTPERYFYNPPFYFWLLGLWFRLVGIGLLQARLLAAGASVLTLLVLAVLLRRLIGNWALLAILLLGLDGWMVFTNRVAWMENVGFVFAVGGLWLYERALANRATLRFAAAGLVLMWATVFKYQFLYLFVAVLIGWAVTRRRHWGHLVLFLTSGLSLGVYLAVMLTWGGTDFRRETFGQLLRLEGKKASSGTVNSLGQVIQAFENQYAIYFGMLVGLAISALVVTCRMLQIVVRRFSARGTRIMVVSPSLDESLQRQRWSYAFERVSGNALLFAWAAAAFICFGLDLKVRLPHYTFLVIVPMYCYLVTEIRGYLERAKRRRARGLFVTALTLVIVGSGLYATYTRMVLDNRDAFQATAAWIDQNVPKGSLVVTEEPIGNNTPDGVNWGKTLYAGRYEPSAKYLVEYETLTFEPPPSPALTRMIENGQLVRVFKDFKATIKIYKLKPTSR